MITFIDFKKAFDSVHRGKMINMLRAYGIPEKIIQAVAAGYKKTRAKVLSFDGQTRVLWDLSERSPGRHIGPYLFILALDYALRQAINGNEEELGLTLIPRKSRRIQPIMITDLDFTDDIALIEDTVEKAMASLSAVKSECTKLGLHLTKVMAFNTRYLRDYKRRVGTRHCRWLQIPRLLCFLNRTRP